MPRLTPDKWQDVRAEYEAGASQYALAARFDVSRTAIQKRIDREGWTQDLEPAIRRKVAEKVAGAGSTGNPEKRAAAMDAEAERRADILRRHREEPMAVRSMVYDAMKKHKSAVGKQEKADAFDDLKAAKISSEILLNVHRLERQAWGLEEQKIEHSVSFSDEERLERLAVFLERSGQTGAS